MGQILVDSDEFQNIVACFLLEALQTKKDGKYVFTNELFDQVLDRMWNAGIRSNLLYAYLSMDGNDRVKYKMISKTLFNEANNSSTIRVTPIEKVE